MRRSLIIGFLVVVVLLEGAARLLAPHIPGQLVWDTQFTQDKADQIAAAGEVDVVYVGSSVVNAGIDPGLVAANSRFDSGYNSAIPSTTPSTWKVWMRDLVYPDLCPSVTVIGISVRDYNDGNVGIPFDLKSYLPSAGRLELYGQFTSASLEQQIGRYSAFVRIRSRLREPEKVARFLVTGKVPGWPATVLTPEGRYDRLTTMHLSIQQPTRLSSSRRRCSSISRSVVPKIWPFEQSSKTLNLSVSRL